MIALRHLPPSELRRIREIDRSERVTREYYRHDGALELRVLEFEVPGWFATGDGDHSVQANLRAWQPILEAGGTLIGALDGETFAGFAIYRPNLEPRLANFAVLHVSRPYRHKGVGARLNEEVVRLARADGAERLYVSASPTENTVDFYRRQGFEPTDEPNAAMFALEPLDIHMIRGL